MEEVDQFSSWLRAESYQKSQGRGGSDSGQQQGTPEYFRPTESQHITKAVTPTISPESFSMKVTGKSVDVYVGETPGTKRLNIEENRDPACKQEADINSHAQVGLNKGSRSQGPSAVLITTLVEVPTNRPMCMGPQMDNQLSVQNPMNLEAEVEPEELKGGSTSQLLQLKRWKRRARAPNQADSIIKEPAKRNTDGSENEEVGLQKSIYRQPG